MDFGLSDKTLKILRDYFKDQSEIQTVKVYGSRAMGTYEKGSDVDLAIFTNGETDILYAAHIISEIDELPTPYLFDVTDYNHLSNENLKQHIDEIGVVLYQK